MCKSDPKPIRIRIRSDRIFSDFGSSKIISDRIKLFCSQIGSDRIRTRFPAFGIRKREFEREGRCIWSCLLVGIVQNMDWTGLDSWTGLLDWTVELDYWTGQLDWTIGLDSWTGLLDWISNGIFSIK